MNNLVFVSNALINSEPYTTESIIAEHAQVETKTVRRLVNKYKNDLEQFGVLRFKISKPTGLKGGRPSKNYFLNEQQATLLITYLNNTEPVREFKKSLVSQFFKMRNELEKRKIYKEIEKPVRRSLVQSIKEWKYSNNWSYKTITDLICKTVTGKSTKKLKLERGCDTDIVGTDIYTSEELETYNRIESKVITMLDVDFTYQQIKENLIQ